MIERPRFARHIAMSAKPEVMLRWLKGELGMSLIKINQAVKCCDIWIEQDRLIIHQIKATKEDEKRKAIRRALFSSVGKVQLPDLLVRLMQ